MQVYRALLTLRQLSPKGKKIKVPTGCFGQVVVVLYSSLLWLPHSLCPISYLIMISLASPPPSWSCVLYVPAYKSDVLQKPNSGK